MNMIHQTRWALVAFVILLASARPSRATPETVLSPTGSALPAGVTQIGGIVVDLVGTNNVHVTSQLAASGLFTGYQNVSPLTIGTQTGFTSVVVDALGGGLSQVAIRITLFDGDSAAGDFDFNDNTLVVNGVSFGNFSAVPTTQTDPTGTTNLSQNTAGGFRNDLLDTGFFYLSTPASLAALFAQIAATNQLVFEITDPDLGDNFLDFTQGVDGGLVDVGQGPSVSGGGQPTPAATVSGPVTIPTVVLVDFGSINSALQSGLPVAQAQEAILLNVIRAATRDLNSRLVRMRAGSTFSPPQASPTGAAGPAGQELVKRGSDGKMLTAGKDYKETPPEPSFKRLELFGAGYFGNFDVDDQGSRAGFDTDTYAGSVGVEYKFNKHFVLGLGVSYLESDTDISRDLGNTETEGIAVSAYASAFFGNLYIDLFYSYGVFDNDIDRNTLLGSTARGDAESRNHNVSLNTGYNFEIGRLRTGPLLALDYISGELDGWNEKGGGRANLNFREQDYESLVTKVGWQASLLVPTKFGSITPQVRASWDRENLNGSDASVALLNSPFTVIDGSGARTGGDFSVTEGSSKPGRDYLNVGVALLANLGDRASLVVDYEAHLFQKRALEQSVTARIGIAF